MVFSDHGGLFIGAALQRWGLFAHTDSSLVSSRQVCGLPRAAMACVPIRVQGGRRAVAVLREASRPNRLYYSHWGRDAGGESRESTFVQREEGCGKTLGMRASRLATTVKPPLALLSWSGAQERAEPWQAEVAPTRPRTWRSFSR